MNTMKVEVVVPDFVRWITVDKDGEVWGFENKPHSDYPSLWDDKYCGESQRLATGKPPKNWKEELYTWG